MWTVIKTAIQDLWPLLAPITAALRFATALIDLVVAVIRAGRRIRQGLRHRRGEDVNEAIRP